MVAASIWKIILVRFIMGDHGFAKSSFAIQKAKDSKICIILSPHIKIMDNFIKDLKVFIESVIISTIVAVAMYYLFSYIFSESPIFTDSEAKMNVFWVALVYGTPMAIYGILEHFKAESPASSKPKKNI